MKKLQKFALCGLTLASISVLSTPISNVYAAEVKEQTEKLSTPNLAELNILDKSVIVKNNQFILTNSNDINISVEKLKYVESTISKTNDYIKNNNLVIDTNTKTAIQKIHIPSNPNDISFRSYGRNGILKIRWNSVTIGVDQGLANDILHAGIAGGAGYLGFLASGPGAAAVVSIVSVIVDRHLDAGSGWWFDFNIFTRTITNFGRQ